MKIKTSKRKSSGGYIISLSPHLLIFKVSSNNKKGFEGIKKKIDLLSLEY